jgi:hypothetical protein
MLAPPAPSKRRAQDLVLSFWCDPQEEGVFNEWSTSEVAEVLRAGLLQAWTCDRPFKNARSAPKGEAEAQRL